MQNERSYWSYKIVTWKRIEQYLEVINRSRCSSSSPSMWGVVLKNFYRMEDVYIDAISQFLKGDTWRTKVMSCVDVNCDKICSNMRHPIKVYFTFSSVRNLVKHSSGDLKNRKMYTLYTWNPKK